MEMKALKLFGPILFSVTVLFTGSVSAYEMGQIEEVCKKPQFKDFNLPVYKEPEKTEVAPESTLSILVSPWVNPETIKLTVKDQAMDITIESNNSFHRVKAKLPTSFNGNIVRINVSAKALLGCSNKAGWLIKVADKS
jgi:hypothetical protein